MQRKLPRKEEFIEEFNSRDFNVDTGKGARASVMTTVSLQNTHVCASVPDGELQWAISAGIEDIPCDEGGLAERFASIEVRGLSTTGSTRRIDMIAFQDHRRGFIIDPTVRFETCKSQPQDVHKEPTIPYYQEKHQMQQIEVIGLMVGARGFISKQRLRWAGHVARMGESRNAYRMLVGRPDGKRPLGRPRRRWEDNIKMDLRVVGYDDREWINLAQDRDQWRAYVKATMNLRLPTRLLLYKTSSVVKETEANLLTAAATISLPQVSETGGEGVLEHSRFQRDGEKPRLLLKVIDDKVKALCVLAPSQYSPAVSEIDPWTSRTLDRHNDIQLSRVKPAPPKRAIADDDTAGPVYIREPPNRVDFSNTTGAVVECSARGNPVPEIIWVRADGTAVGDVPGLRQVLANGNLVFPPFRAEDYRQEVHAQVYVCLAKNSVGSIHSRDVNVRAVVQQFYDTDVNKEYAIRGNSAVLKCQVPSFVADFVSVVSWHTDQGDDFYPSTSDYVVNQYYEAEVVSEYVIRGNTAVLKCNIPSFVADFVKVESWVGSEGTVYLPSADYVVNQFYEAEILTEYVIRGNTAVLKCSIPSFVADFVRVEAWIADDGEVHMPSSDNYVVAQYYVTEAENEYVIRGNSAVMKCKIPSFVADFVSVESWVADDGEIHTYSTTSGNYVVSQSYEAEADNEYVIRGNSAVMKCEVPSFVADFVVVEMWLDSAGNTYLPGSDYVVHQFYQSRVIDEFVLRGNTATLKCLIPSFVADFVQVVEWITDDGSFSATPTSDTNYVVNQYYEAQVYDVFVIKGNAAVFKCNVPSFVSDHVEIIGWEDTQGNRYLPPADYVVTQRYEVNVMDEHVLRGNTAIIKCHIPSFVADYVFVSSWLENEHKEIFLDGSHYDGKYLVLPSGELHIRDVGPEDGYKSYQCRTKHRLTGETRLSATKGRLVITEPIGSTAPKFPSSNKINAFEKLIGETMVVFCPAQGFPLPAFRQLIIMPAYKPIKEQSSHSHLSPNLFARGFKYVKLKKNFEINSYLVSPSEPVGSSAPKFPTIDKSRGFEAKVNQNSTLLCPAQGFPVPVFRASRQFHTKISNYGQCPGFPSYERSKPHIAVPCSGLSCSFIQSLLEVQFLNSHQWIDYKALKLSHTWAMHCSVQHRDFLSQFTEPVSSTVPRIPSMAKFDMIERHVGKELSLLCQAQGHPVPNFR
ncbi:hypothetical protein ANN_18355 [Periplaneta americana]|uniref:Ig-like domain-containing protein n=1 Tax=Periplaneta americana TaxID=6978 RepID=A0ABQ8SP60_PERAM|nr:hypothetical protein ANN_18355 [Periplaneta americana]